jgi:hypothetical protein
VTVQQAVRVFDVGVADDMDARAQVRRSYATGRVRTL